MGKAILRALVSHFRDNLILYFLVNIFLVLGILIGATSVKSLDPEQTVSLGDYLNNFVTAFPNLKIRPEVLTTASFASNVKLLLLIWF